jgi:hypothetical protein
VKLKGPVTFFVSFSAAIDRATPVKTTGTTEATVSILNMGYSFRQGLQVGYDQHLPSPFLFFLPFFFRFFSFLHRFVHLPSTQRGQDMRRSPVCL